MDIEQTIAKATGFSKEEFDALVAEFDDETPDEYLEHEKTCFGVD